ncbi:hypothetical protein SARC_12522 [Sphaeroforma arctica JP610]|uniref:Uncharacterized protein n=1 Tax=Sphaeroforma arctica JP610 TaxID=667725 RepID=A0A0L0FEN7_9EUKA|nr:hypothetical protein SARC_12522 [Sphaeroforma arctica JP610]KNC74941.1 hypothetical protein SARC_12522 [Sphaeroforma arctica JP610]|eukprot:XP_014148843.1 hypothetical protein SARC_12522 [Sphaeroforma arctica JP610]
MEVEGEDMVVMIDDEDSWDMDTNILDTPEHTAENDLLKIAGEIHVYTYGYSMDT